MPDLGKPEILILLIVILVLFGAKRLPGAARSLGQSMRIFKAETKGLRSDDDAVITPPPAATPAPPAAAAHRSAACRGTRTTKASPPRRRAGA
jgi:sec-independent protein translocase protein TatA